MPNASLVPCLNPHCEGGEIRHRAIGAVPGNYSGAPPERYFAERCPDCKGHGVAFCRCGALATMVVEGEPSCDPCEAVNAPTRGE